MDNELRTQAQRTARIALGGHVEILRETFSASDGGPVYLVRCFSPSGSMFGVLTATFDDTDEDTPTVHLIQFSQAHSLALAKFTECIR
jgi:hypothetical protein